MKTRRVSVLVGSFLFTSAMTLAACSEEPPIGSASRAIVETSCADDSQCPAGFECEIEVEHGVTTSFCQAHEESSDCPDGLELEVEHGQEFCRPHGGDGDDEAGAPDSGSGVCTTDADCPAGYECETELEHGQTTSSCEPHGGH
jgi:Cys-rich repeat protein